jgi:uncharacterized cupin superfamily protein
MEIDDAAAGRGGDVEARFARSHLGSEHLGVSYFRYGPGFRSTLGHSHREQEEAYVVVSGSGRMKLDDEIIAIGSDRPEGGDGVQLPEWWTDH